MITLTLITVGTLKESYLREAVAEYEKRISAFARLHTVVLKEERVADEQSPASVAAALAAEAERIRAAIPEGAYKVAMCIEGKQMDSPTLARTLEQGFGRGGKLAVIIGSSHGLDPSVKSLCDLRLSMSPLTFPHQLARVMTLEALYRSFTILAGKPYHK